MELSELVAFNDEILTVCDKTGIVFKVLEHKNSLAPYLILADGDGLQKSGFSTINKKLSGIRPIFKFQNKTLENRRVSKESG